MCIRDSSRLITICIIILSVTGIGSLFQSYRLLERHKLLSARLLQSDSSINAIISGSDILTAAIRSYASTGDKKFKNDFLFELQVSRSRDKAMITLEEIGLLSTELDQIRNARSNSDALVLLEEQVLAAADVGDLPKAISIAFGEEYVGRKASIINPIVYIRDKIKERSLRERETVESSMFLYHIIAISSILLSGSAIMLGLIPFFQRKIVRPINYLTDIIRKLAEGNTGISINFKDELAEMNDLANALESFRIAKNSIEKQRWVKMALTEIIEQVHRSPTVEIFARELLESLCPMLGAPIALLYFKDSDTGSISCMAGYGVKEDAYHGLLFSDEGLVSEACRTKRPLIVKSIPPNYPRIISGLGNSLPHMIIVIPIIPDQAPSLSIELGLLSELTDEQKDLLDELPKAIAPHLVILLRNIHTRILLDKSVMQAENLEATKKELQETEERWRLALETSRDGVWDIDLDIPENSFFSRNFHDMNRYGNATITDIYQWINNIHKEDKEAKEVLNRCVKREYDKDTINISFRMICRDGIYRWRAAKGQIFRNKQGRIVRLIGILEDIHEQKEREDSYAHRSMHDSLTGLPNREFFNKQMKHMTSYAYRTGTFVIVAMLDLDRFKLVNDTLGHHAGDILLTTVGRRLQKALRNSDFVARLGGDEFAMLLTSETNIYEDATRLMERLQTLLNEPAMLETTLYSITASIGLAVYPKDGENTSLLMKRADKAMYHAKISGRNAFCFWNSDMEEEI